MTAYSIVFANDSDEKKWNDYVHTHPDGSPYHLFGWKKAVEKSYGHEAVYMYAEKGGQIAGVLPLVHMRLPVLVNDVVGLPYCDMGSVLSDNDDIAELLLHKAVTLSSGSGAGLELRGEVSASLAASAALRQVHTHKVRMVLQLPGSSEELFAGFKSKLRSQIRKAEKNNLSFRWGTAADLADWYRVFSENMRDLGSPVHSMRWFENILLQYGDNAHLGIVEYEKKVIAGSLLLSSGGTICIPWASTMRKFNKLAPNMLLYWHALEYAADNDFRLFDFGRSTEGEGTYRFKKQWGAAPTPLIWYTAEETTGGDAENGHRRSSRRDAAAAVWKRLPLVIANLIGPAIRKHISL